ncbi:MULTISPECIES: tripartite tricarboxylate transporter substrate binding protein [unclassified Beijerinckia]|uniref:Bug family tripartite tricarboxylate transporter substrate binding protein n=1 Tax=unclassified Beijerinckia TaxID=2638183 RepID=UPI00089BA903|nr:MULTISPECIES: tripartite tricarboxylate transporter substrate binding protein [unclassified Beijerinckia]MDH7799425.1 tripartite-type tricarboxylate transporter receptor subunit TctC [Beijerinckia sp. GAS462]SED49976.1 Tripartite-type tricarboxylate transporter, receptor component TctC [Beijerinckia sp. 28-YEA-48]
MKVLSLSMACAALATMIVTAAAQQDPAPDFPKASIKLVVSAAAGGGNDMIARLVAERLQAKWGQSVIVENRTGAGNNIATEYVYKSPPDGYTLLVSPPASLTVNVALFKDLRFDPTKIEAVSITSYIPNVLLVGGNSRFKTAQDFLDFAKANPGKLSYASQGMGTTGHLTGALLEQLLGTKQLHVPYGGAAPALNDIIAGHIDFMIADIGTVLPLAQDGKLRMLATLTKDPSPVAPELPTIAAVGLPELLSDTWTAFTAPPGTPLPIRQKYAMALREIIFSPDIRTRIEQVGIVPWGLDPQQSAEVIRRETARWTDVVRKAGVRLD